MTIDPIIPPSEFHQQALDLGIEFEPSDTERLGRYLALLLDANTKFNLTAITDPAQAWSRHILDSLTLLPVLASLMEDRTEPLRVIDIGSGGGLPGLPLAIAMPATRFTLVDATGKKATFLRETAATLQLTNVTVLQIRAERLGQQPAHREVYDAATARAVGRLNILAELTLPLVRVGGVALAMKGIKAEEELTEAGAALGMLGGRHDQTIETATGRIIVLAKATRTPRDYPRPDGEPASKPLTATSKIKRR